MARGDITLTTFGQGRFRHAPAQVFTTDAGVRLVYQLVEGCASTVVYLGGGMSGRQDTLETLPAQDGLESHAMLVFDRRNTGASDVYYDDIGSGDGRHASENHAQVDWLYASLHLALTSQNSHHGLQVEDLRELIEGLQIAPVILFGHSSGARLFGMFTIAYPGLVKGLVLSILTGGLPTFS